MRILMQQRIARDAPVPVQINTHIGSEIIRARLVPLRAFRLGGKVRVNVDHRDLIHEIPVQNGVRIGKIGFLTGEKFLEPFKERFLA